MTSPSGPAIGPVLALDLGATQIRTAVVDADGRVVARRSARTPVADGPDAIVAACIRLLVAVRTDHAGRAAAGSGGYLGIGISAPGPLDPSAGIVLGPPNLGPAFRDVPIRERVAAVLDLPAFLDRDANVAGAAEGAFGIAAGVRDYLYLTFSSGVGGSIISDGRILRGPDGTAGELGHVPVDRDGPPCGCGAPGHLEAIASGVAIARAARAAAARGESRILADAVRDAGDGFEARHVAEAEDLGDVAAASIMADARRAFAAAAIGFVNVFNPDLIVVGGSLARGQGERWLAPAREAVACSAFGRPAGRVRIVPAALGDDAGLIGGLVLVRRGLSVVVGRPRRRGARAR